MRNKKHIEKNKNENVTYQNLWDTAKAVLRGTFIAKKKRLTLRTRMISNNLTLHLKELRKEQQTEPNISRRK